MKGLQNILVAMDFADASVNALHAAGKISEVFASRIIVLHVITDENLSEETESFMRDFLHDRYENVSASLPESVRKRMEFVIEKGSAFQRIARQAIERDVNVIIAGSGNNGTGNKYPLGTTVEKLIRKNQVPLWVIREGDDWQMKKILCPVDFSDASVRALNNAILLASRFGSELEVMHVFTPLDIQSARLKVDNEKENREMLKARNADFERFIEKFDFGSVPFRLHLAEGTPEQTILEHLESGSFDLLIMGTTGRTGLSRILMGSVTEKVTREVPVSFITTKSKDLARTYFESNLDEIESFIRHAAESRRNGDLEQAVDVYLLGLKQFPDNIPMLIGLRDCYKAMGDQAKSDFYREYATEVVQRVWGEEYLETFGLK